MTIGPLGADQQDAITALLGASGLPTADLSPAIHFLGVRDARGLEAVVGLERHGELGLLRSLAVRADRRTSGVGSALVNEVERTAAQSGVHTLYLLTTTAEAFFARRGYERVSREATPAGIRETSEFASVCPASAVVMCKPLGAIE